MSIKHTYLNNANPLYVEDLFKKYQKDPLSVDEKWRIFFEGYELAKENSLTDELDEGGRFDRESQVTKLIHAYRSRGHIASNTNPLESPIQVNDLEKEYYHLKDKDLQTVFNAGNNLRIGPANLETIIQHLKKTYVSTMGIEFVHCTNNELRQWIYKAIEPSGSTPQYSNEKKMMMLKHLYQASLFEDFLHRKYAGQKRFSLEGLDAFIPGLIAMIRKGTEIGGEEFVIGMAHRGRLNVLVNVLKKPFYNVFSEFEGGELSKAIQGNGDVKYHLGQSTDVVYNGKEVHLSLAFNPSHLEAVATVVQGIVRGKAIKYYQNNVTKVIPIVVHGDASVSGQGVVYELANMSRLEGYDNGGSIHVVLNNQLGFTANASETRSSLYCTDVAKITDSPIFHVNANDVEKVVYAFDLAIEIRQQFQIDVWIELLGYRRRGHNEGDEPRFTSPMMYNNIDNMPTVTEIYSQKLFDEKVVTQKWVDQIVNEFNQSLEKDLELARKKKFRIEVNALNRFWQSIRPAEDKDFVESIPTAVTKKKIDELMKKVSEIPADFKINPKLKKLLEARSKLYSKKQIDWAMGEQLAYASLLDEGHSVRITGQDSGRGTFSHRHAVFYDTKTEKTYIPLESCNTPTSRFRVINSLLSEYSVLGFEYGYSLTRPFSLVIWEAQFGDFANGAQIIIDQFIAAGEVKWQRHSGLVMFLPHGYEGMGPEHSSARLERFLNLCFHNNMYLVNPTTPANFFHLLRRQIKNKFRKPLVVMSPKSLFRHPAVISSTDEISKPGRCFREIIDDEGVNPKKVKRLILCTGKIYYDLVDYRKEKKRIEDIALVRFEQLYPIVRNQLQAIKKKYSMVKEIYWVQEEPRNMGAWSFIKAILGSWKINDCISRNSSPSPASGSLAVHKANQERILRKAIDL